MSTWGLKTKLTLSDQIDQIPPYCIPHICREQRSGNFLGSVYIAEVNVLFYTHALIETGETEFCMFDSSHEHEF